MKRTPPFVIQLAFMLLFSSFNSETSGWTLNGTVSHKEVGLSNASIEVFNHHARMALAFANTEGDFSADIDPTKHLTVYVSYDGFATQIIEIVPTFDEQASSKEGTKRLNVELFRVYPEINMTALQFPVARYKFGSSDEALYQDELYQESITAAIDPILEQVKLKEAMDVMIAKRKEIEAADYRAQGNWAQAIRAYHQAIALNPLEEMRYYRGIVDTKYSAIAAQKEANRTVMLPHHSNTETAEK